MDMTLRRAIDAELEPAERLLWAARPSLRFYAQRMMPLTLLFVVIPIAVAATFGGTAMAAIAHGNEHVGWILVSVVVVLPLLVALAELRLRRNTIYAITDRRLLRAGGRSMLTNRPGQTFSYLPEEVSFVQVRSFGLWQHVYIDRQSWGDSVSRNIMIGFEDVANTRAVGERITAWLDDYQQGILAGAAERRAVTNDDYGFAIEVPVSWTAEVGSGGDTDLACESPADWETGLRPWNCESGGWNRLRVTGPAGTVLAVEALRGAAGRTADEPNAMAARVADLLGLQHESAETEFLGMPATLFTWSADMSDFRVLVFPRGEVELRIHMIARSTMPDLMNELQAIAESFQPHAAIVEKAS